MKKPVLSEKTFTRCVARAFSLEEASGIAKQFEAQSYETNIVENKKGAMAIYEVWASKKAEGFELKPSGKIGHRFIGTD